MTKINLNYNKNSDFAEQRKRSVLDVTAQVIYAKRKTEARLCNHCCSGKAVRIIYHACVCVCLCVCVRVRACVCLCVCV